MTDHTLAIDGDTSGHTPRASSGTPDTPSCRNCRLQFRARQQTIPQRWLLPSTNISYGPTPTLWTPPLQSTKFALLLCCRQHSCASHVELCFPRRPLLSSVSILIFNWELMTTLYSTRVGLSHELHGKSSQIVSDRSTTKTSSVWILEQVSMTCLNNDFQEFRQLSDQCTMWQNN